MICWNFGPTVSLLNEFSLASQPLRSKSISVFSLLGLFDLSRAPCETLQGSLRCAQTASNAGYCRAAGSNWVL